MRSSSSFSCKRSERGGAGLFFLAATGFLFFAVYSVIGLYSERGTVDAAELPPLDAVVCLAGGKGRIAQAADLFLKLDARHPQARAVLFIVGMGKDADWGAFASQLSPDVLSRLPRERVVLENKSRNTVENAKMVLREAGARRWTRVLVVTSTYHLKRARSLFERESRFDPDFRMEWLPLQIEPFTPGGWWKSYDAAALTLLEWAKGIYYSATAWQP